MKEPKDAVVLAARIAKSYPTLSAYSAATLAEELCAIERAQRRHAERCCNGRDGGYVRYRRASGSQHGGLAVDCEHDPDAEERAGKRIGRRLAKWRERIGELRMHAFGADPSKDTAEELRRRAGKIAVDLQGDPRGAVLLLRLPGETEARAV